MTDKPKKAQEDPSKPESDSTLVTLYPRLALSKQALDEAWVQLVDAEWRFRKARDVFMRELHIIRNLTS